MDAAYHRRGTIVGSRGTIDTDFLNHTSAQLAGDRYGYLPSLLRVRRGTANTTSFEEIHADSGSGFRFAAEAFASVVGERDFVATRRGGRQSRQRRHLGSDWPQFTIGAGGAGAGSPFPSNADP